MRSPLRTARVLAGTVVAALLVLAASQAPLAAPVSRPDGEAVARVPSSSSATPARWVPRPGTTWQWQLTGRVDVTVKAAVFDVDGVDTPASTVAELHRRGRKVVCYVSVGAWESWRPDAKAFPAEVLGRTNGWPGERWLDVRRLDVLAPIIARRFDVCRSKGFDAVEPDNVDGWANRTGFPLTAADQLAFNRRVAALAHARGMSVALKNDLDQVAALEPAFDFAVNEECFAFSECRALRPFVAAGKAVLHVEYQGSPSTFCPTTTRLGLSSLRKRTDLGVWRLTC